MSDPLRNEEINKKREELFKKRRAREKSDLLKVLNTAEGRRFVWRFMSEARVFHSCFDLNPIQMAKNEGKRDMGLFLLVEIMTENPEIFAHMQREAKSDKFLRDVESKKITEGDDE